jgi:CRISPR system Cascade subunit CasA
MSEYFNLLDEPWLPVRLVSGSVQNMGLLEVFARSGEIVALAETSPPSLVAEYRLLLAITHRALGHGLKSWKNKDRARWYREGLPLDVIHAYLKKWRDRFWLFHPQYPFMQVAAPAEAEKTRDKRKPWTQISLASASGNVPVVFDHAMDDLPDAINFAKTVGTLLGFLQFAPPGLVQVLKTADKAGALANTAAVIPVGQTLMQTLCLCLHSAPTSHGDDDKPAWEQEPLTIAQLRGTPTLASGPNDRYTRQSRAVLLLRENDSKIRWLRFAVGYALEESEYSPDLMASFREGSNELVRLTFRDGRALWRDLPALVPSGKGQMAAILNGAIGLHPNLSSDDMMQPILVAGVASKFGKPAVLERWRIEQLVLPTVLLTDTDKARSLCHLVEQAETLFGELRALAINFMYQILPNIKHEDRIKKAREMIDRGSLSPNYFAAAERALPQIMGMIADGQLEQAYTLWKTVLRDNTKHTWEQMRKCLGQSARVLRADAKCWPRLHGVLNKHAPKDKAVEPDTVETET